MKRKILLGRRFEKEGFSGLDKDFDLVYPGKDFFDRDETIRLLGDCEVFVPGSDFRIDSEIIDNGLKLKLIANYGVGYDNIDVGYATAKGIVVTNTPDSVTEPTAELCFGLMLATARRIGFYDRHIRMPGGLKWGLYDNLGVTLYGKTLGIIGMGRIGQALARRALASGMNIIYHNRKPLGRNLEDRYMARYAGFNELLSTADFISLNVPATRDTYHMIGQKELEMVKPTAIIINAARGNLIDEKALADALENKKIYGAGLDVFGNEPEIDEWLKNTEQVVLTPHAGTRTMESRLEMQKEVAANIIGFFNGGHIAKVNMPG